MGLKKFCNLGIGKVSSVHAIKAGIWGSGGIFPPTNGVNNHPETPAALSLKEVPVLIE
jgi:hypothetical protein